MRKAIIVCVVLLGISLFATIVSAVVCGGELLKWGIECGIEHYEEYIQEKETNDIEEIIETTIPETTSESTAA